MASAASTHPEPRSPNRPTISPFSTASERPSTSDTVARALSSKTISRRTLSAGVARRVRRAALRCASRFAQHLGDDVGARDLAGDVIASDAPVAHDDDTVRNGEDFSQPMRNEYDRDAASLERPDAVEQPQRLRFPSAQPSARRRSAASSFLESARAITTSCWVARSSEPISGAWIHDQARNP